MSARSAHIAAARPLLRSGAVHQGDAPRPDWLEAALVAALEAIDAPAFLVCPGQAPARANRAGRILQQREPTLAASLCEATRDAAEGSSFRSIPLAGFEGHYLLVHIGQADDTARLRLARERWRLSRRQAQILGLLVCGRSNKEIMSALRLGQSTVEHHVTGLLARAGVDCRAALVAKFYREIAAPGVDAKEPPSAA